MDKPSVTVIEPGLVLIRGILSAKEEEQMSRDAWSWGSDESSGFFDNFGTPNAEGRGRIFDAAERFPSWLGEVCDQSVLEARAQDPLMPMMNYTHLLLNCYMSRGGIEWHRDVYENDGTSDHPVVNLTLGAACNFLWKHETMDEEQSIILESGDILLFGGPCRLMLHQVKEILLERIPPWMETFEPDPMRFSFTFRDAPEVCGREKEFKSFHLSQMMAEQDAYDAVDRGARVQMHAQ